MKYKGSLTRFLFLGLFLFLLTINKLRLWLVLFAITLLLAVFFGRIYCGYICPINTVMIPTDKLAKKINSQADNSPKWLLSGNFAWLSLILSVIIFILTRKVFNKDFPILLFWLLTAIIITLRYKTDVFHNLICPFGKLQKFFGQFAKFSHYVDKSACVGCKLCETVCPNVSVVVDKESRKATIDKALCLQCNSCQKICPTKAISYINTKK